MLDSESQATARLLDSGESSYGKTARLGRVKLRQDCSTRESQATARLLRLGRVQSYGKTARLGDVQATAEKNARLGESSYGKTSTRRVKLGEHARLGESSYGETGWPTLDWDPVDDANRGRD